jgi:hypothetical protein
VRQFCPTLIFSFCIALTLVRLVGSVRAEEKTAAQAAQLLSEAIQLSDIRARGSTPFRLNARLVGTEDKDHPIEAAYSLEWQSPTSWRDELSATNYEEVRVAWSDRLFISRKPSNPVAALFHLRRLIEFPVRFDLNPIMRIEKLSENRSHGNLQRIVEVSAYDRFSIKVYLGESLPTISRIENKGVLYPGYPFNDFGSSLEYQDYQEFHGRQFPHKLIQRDSGRATGEVEIVEVTDAPPQTTSFDPPPDARWTRWCAHPTPAHPILNRNLLPLMALPPPGLHPPLHVQVYGIIGTDGLWHNLTVLKSEAEAVDSYFLKTLARAKYSPATCDGKPVETEEIRDFYYSH